MVAGVTGESIVRWRVCECAASRGCQVYELEMRPVKFRRSNFMLKFLRVVLIESF